MTQDVRIGNLKTNPTDRRKLITLPFKTPKGVKKVGSSAKAKADAAFKYGMMWAFA